ncbi:MAG TPA: riboflavin biosynthesis protein RibF [Gaiellaceae bacterium]|nr:riboflavin biosynthesis protein RibF [Gaiellaceae bacterium]
MSGRAIAVGTFDGVHLGHRRVIETAQATGLPTAVVTFDPHPRIALGNRVELLTTLDRRLELLRELGVDDIRVVPFTSDLALSTPEEFVDAELRPLGATVVAAGENFRFGRGRSGDLDTLERLGLGVRRVPLVDGVSSSRIRQLIGAGEVEGAARLLGRPPEVEGTVVAGDARGGTLGYPTANLAVPRELIVPAYGIYAGQVGDHRAAISIGVNPHYGGDELRVEAFLLDFAGDLYGQRLIVELWQRLREERAFGSEQELIDQIARDVEAARAATRPS